MNNKNKYDDKKKNILNRQSITPTLIYFICSISGIVLFFCVAFFMKGKAFDWLVMENNSDWAMLDFFRLVFFAINRNTVYVANGTDAGSPPLAFMFYHFISKISITGDITEYSLMPQMPYQALVFLLYSVIGILILVYAIEELKVSNWQKKLLMFSLLFSTPLFAGALERGNMALYVMSFLSLSMQWKDSENKIKREFALILIAVSTGLKIYPAFFGLLYLREKRWQEAVRLIIYGIILFFGPFVFFGGVEGFFDFLNLILHLSRGEFGFRVQFFRGLLASINITGMSAQLMNYAFLFLLFIMALVSKCNIRRMTYLAAAMAFFPSGAYRYTLLYFVMPLFAFILENKKSSIDGYINAIFLGLLFSIPTLFGIFTNFKLGFGLYTLTGVEFFIYIIAWSYLLYQIVMDLLFTIKMKMRKKHPHSLLKIQ